MRRRRRAHLAGEPRRRQAGQEHRRLAALRRRQGGPRRRCSPLARRRRGQRRRRDVTLRRLRQFRSRTICSTRARTSTTPRTMVGRSSLLHVKMATSKMLRTAFLFENDADVDRSKRDGVTPLHIACETGNIDAVRLLLNYDATINQADDDGNSPLFYACRKDDNVDILVCERGERRPEEQERRLAAVCCLREWPRPDRALPARGVRRRRDLGLAICLPSSVVRVG